MNVEQAIYDGLLSSGMISDEDDINQLAKNLTEDVEMSEADTVELLVTRFDNGVGEQKIKDLFRLVCLEDPNLAQTILDELRYWSNHGNNQGNV